MNEKYSEFAWHIGITSSAVSSRVKPMSSAVTSEISALPAWLRIAPFGWPVVPDVYISAHVSVGRDDDVRRARPMRWRCSVS